MKIKKMDIILGGFIIIVGIASSLYITFGNGEIKDAQVSVYVNNEVYGTYSLDEDRKIEVKQGNHINKITIKEGNAQMTFSDCHNQDCVKQGKINDGSKSIICLPNKVVVEINSNTSDYDAITR